MKFLDALIDTPRVTISIMALILFAGVISRVNLPVETEPAVDVPLAMVFVSHPGISPEDGIRLLVRPIEKELKTLEGVEEVISTARADAVYMLVEFDVDENVKSAISDLREAVDRASADFPVDTDEPVVDQLSAGEGPDVIVALSGELVSERALMHMATHLQKHIEKIPQVLEATLYGDREEVVEVVLQPHRLQEYLITMAEVLSVVTANNLLIPAGDMDSGAGRFNIVVPGLIESAADIGSLPVRSTSEGVITLADIAQVRRTFKDALSFSILNGERAISIDVKRRSGTNSIETVLAVRDLVEREKDFFSKKIKIDFIFDNSSQAESMVDELSGNILTAMSLVLILVVATLGVKSGFLVSLGIPFCMLGSIIIITVLGYTYNFMIMFGLLLSLGMLIDGAIVIVEFANTQAAQGLSSRDAYRNAVRRMGLPVTASIGTTLAAFLPLLFWPGVAGQFMSYLPATVFAVLTWSLMYALVFAPTLGVLLTRAQAKENGETATHQSEEAAQALFLPLLRGYLWLLERVIKRPIKSILLAFSFICLIVISYIKFGAGQVFFQDIENQFGVMTVRAQGNFSVEQKREMTAMVETRVREGGIPEILQLYSSSQNMGLQKDSSRDQISNFFVELVPTKQRELNSTEVFARVREVTAGIPGLIVDAQNINTGPPTGKDIQIQVSSINRAAMHETAAIIRQWIGENVEGIRGLEDTLPISGVQWKMEVDRPKASMQGADVATVGQAIQLVTDGLMIGKFRPDDAEEEVEIRLRFPEKHRQLSALDSLRINSQNGSVPISDFTSRLATPKMDIIQRLDMEEAVLVMAYTEDGYLPDNQTRQIQSWLATQNFHPDVEVTIRGANEEQAKSAAFLSTAFSMALGLMLIMMVAQFNSFYHAFLILLAVVISTAGVLLGLVISQNVFSTILTGVGIVALAGIVVNNNIVLIDTFNFIRKTEPNLNPRQAVYRAARSRFRPVLLTTITTIVGLLPLANGLSVDIVNRSWEYGGSVAMWWQPLASAIVNGLALSTLMTLLLTPAMLLLPEVIHEKVFNPKSG